ncbi:MAG: hypothetical protein ACTSX1_00660, partial [Candidatus Heimdallarchaeaceae archaeon]
MPLYYLLECDDCDRTTKQFIGVKGLMFPSTIGFPSEGWHIDVKIIGETSVNCKCPRCYAKWESDKQMEQIA